MPSFARQYDVNDNYVLKYSSRNQKLWRTIDLVVVWRTIDGSKHPAKRYLEAMKFLPYKINTKFSWAPFYALISMDGEADETCSTKKTRMR